MAVSGGSEWNDGAHVGRREAIKLPRTSSALAITMFDASNAAPLADALIPSVEATISSSPASGTATCSWRDLRRGGEYPFGHGREVSTQNYDIRSEEVDEVRCSDADPFTERSQRTQD